MQTSTTRLGDEHSKNLVRSVEKLLDAWIELPPEEINKPIPRSLRRIPSSTRNSQRPERPLLNSAGSLANVFASHSSVDIYPEDQLANHLTFPIEANPSNSIVAQRADSPSTSTMKLPQFDLLWTQTLPANGSNTHCFRYGDRIQPFAISGARLYTTGRTENTLDTQPASSLDFDAASDLVSVGNVGIREHLRLWQEAQDKPPTEAPSGTPRSLRQSNSTENTLTQSTENDSATLFDDALDNDEDDGGLSSSEATAGSEGHYHPFLQPGDVAYFNTAGEPIPTILIRNLGSQAHFYSMQGEWLLRSAAGACFFAVPNMFSLQELDPLLPYLPNEEIDNEALDKSRATNQDVPREIAGALLEKLRIFQRATAEEYRRHLARFDRIHDLVAHQTEIREMTLHEIALVVLQKQHPEELTDVYQEEVIADATAPDGISSIDVTNPLPNFIYKTRRLVQNNRNRREVTTPGAIGPSPRKYPADSSNHDAIFRIKTTGAFSSKERAVLDYLKSWSITGEIPKFGSTWSLGPMLLRAIGLYDGYKLDPRTAYLFLMEIGVLAPWNDRNYYDTNLHIPSQQDLETKHLFDNAAHSVTAIEQGSEKLQDSLASFRKDWGNMAVYCIDDASAREIDDGISIEKVDGDGSAFWVRIHIANPTAFVKPGDAVQQYAARLIQTVYLPDKVYPMIDPGLGQERFSLAKDRPVLTVSIKVTGDGEIIEKDITPGWVHNVKRITPTQVSQALDISSGSMQKVGQFLKVGDHMEQNFHTSKNASLSPTEVSELQRLQQLGRARRLKRTSSSRDSTLMHTYGAIPVPDPRVYIQRDGLGPTYSPVLGRHFYGDPAISWELREIDWLGYNRISEQAFVSDIMVLACEAVGDWCSERNIPVVYRGTVHNTSQSMQAEAYRAMFHNAVSEEHKHLHLKACNQIMGTATQRSIPQPHAILGVRAYTKVTSPLRRYTDMLAHWQLQAALLYEARHGPGSLIGSTDDSYLPFSRAHLDTLIPTMAMRERQIRRVSLKSTRHWIIQLLSRAFYFREAELPATIDVFVWAEQGNLAQGATRDAAGGLMKQLSGFKTHLVANDVSRREGGFKLGDTWQSRIEEVDTYGLRVSCVPIRLLKRDPPAQI
ncbi:MAG: hypothetical protein Q9218_005248 [Villophora microphyllina]